LVTLDVPMADQQEINQVFYTDVKVPKENRIGEENKGWDYAKYLLSFERGNSYGPGLKRAINKVRKIAAQTDTNGAKLIDDVSFRTRLDQLEIEVSALEYFELRLFSAMSAGQRPGAESSLLKCNGTDLQQAISELSVEAIGYYAMPFVRDTWAKTNVPRPGPEFAAPISPYYFNLRKASIYAGSNEIQRNIMAKAVLGL
jgi:alkylation response protein AidB-like acyl-CoA dehydrogenase